MFFRIIYDYHRILLFPYEKTYPRHIYSEWKINHKISRKKKIIIKFSCSDYFTIILCNTQGTFILKLISIIKSIMKVMRMLVEVRIIGENFNEIFQNDLFWTFQDCCKITNKKNMNTVFLNQFWKILFNSINCFVRVMNGII